MANQDPRSQDQDHNQPGAGGAKSAPAGQGDAGQEPGSGSDANAANFVTADKLRQAIDHIQAEVRKSIEKAVGSVKEGLADSIKGTVTQVLTESQAASVTKGAGGQPEKDVELSSLKRKLDESNSRVTALESELTKKKTEEKQMRVKQRILEALNKYDCINAERAYRAIKDDLTHDEETDTIFITVKNEFGGDSRVGLDDYVKNEVRQNILPSMFRGNNRQGAPAEGDSPRGQGPWKYDWRKVKGKPEVISSPEFQQAMAEGLVSNIPANNTAGAV